MISVSLVFLVFVVLFLLGTSTLVFVFYCRVPVEELKTQYSYKPTSSEASFKNTVGLSASGSVKTEDLPGCFIMALLLHEDDLFFCHKGLNWREMKNRLCGFYQGTDPLAGGSSITQQLAKNLFGRFIGKSIPRHFLRKIKELVQSVRLERNFSKSDICTFYVNAVRLGPGNTYGVEVAARRYFDKSAKELNLLESFFLVGLIPQPVWIVEQIFSGKTEAFRYTRAMEKFSDLFRMQISLFGWRALDRLDQITAEEAIAQMENFASYYPKALAVEYEVALLMRSLQSVDQLRELVEAVAARGEQVSTDSHSKVSLAQ